LSILRYDYLQLQNSATANNQLATNPIKENPRMEMPMELSLEQQFMLNVYKQQVKELSQEQAQAYLLEVLRQMMVKENMFKHLLKHA
jgi:Phycobilisome degradation protein nblA